MVKFKISDSTFWGYEYDTSIENLKDYNDPFQQAILNMKEYLKQDLLNLNLEVLAEKIDDIDFHIHDTDDINDITNNDTIIYVCAHCS
jgi:hypothetical protein